MSRYELNKNLAQMLKGGVIMDVTTPEEAVIAEKAGACAVMALEKVPADIRKNGGVARMSDPKMIKEIQKAVSIPVMAKVRIGHFVEAQILESLEIDYIDESEVLTPADDRFHIDKTKFQVPFVCGAKNLGEALRRIQEGASMIRTKGEPGTGDIIEAVKHMRRMNEEIRRISSVEESELYNIAKELGVPYELLKYVHKNKKLPVVNFAAGGVATPADAALMMQLGCDGVFVGSGIFKSGDPAKRAAAIVKAVTNFDNPKVLAEVSEDLGAKTQLLNLDRVEQIAKEHKPKVIIFSPVNYPRVIDYERLAKIAHDIGAYMWFDICQNVGLVATGQIPSPVPYADVVTFSTHDSLRGPQSSVILCKKELADIIDKTVITTGHFSLKKNILASLAVIFKEATTEKFKQYTKQVVLNAKALQKGLEEEGITILCKGTDTNLVLVNLTKLGISCKKAHNALQSAGFIVKPTVLSTCDENLNFEILRLSSLILTTRGLKEVQMEHIGKMMAKVLKNIDDMAIIEEVRQEAVDIAMECPLFSDEWLAFKDVLNPLYSAKDINISHELAAERKMAVMKKLFSFMKK